MPGSGRRLRGIPDAEAKFEEIARRRAKVRDVRARALPRLEPLGYDRNKNAYWVFPRRDTLQMEAVPPAAGVAFTHLGRGPVGRRRRGPSTKGTEVLRQLAASLDERGVRERALKEALADHPPVFGLDDDDDDQDYCILRVARPRACGVSA